MNIKSSRKEYKWTCRRHQKVGATGRVGPNTRDICEYFTLFLYVHIRRCTRLSFIVYFI